MSDIIAAIREELQRNADEEIRASGKRFFKEETKTYGMKTSVVTGLGKQYYKLIKSQDKQDIFALCEELWQSGYMEESYIACNWSYYVRKRYQPGDFAVFERWVDRHVSNWASCDTLCNHTVGAFIEMYPEYLTDLKRWAKSENRWMRRASAVSLIIPAKQGRFLTDIFDIASLLLLDGDDLVQKGYGWMLKEASRNHQQEVFDFVVKHKQVMPRTALRYAIEKMPPELRKTAMQK